MSSQWWKLRMMATLAVLTAACTGDDNGAGERFTVKGRVLSAVDEGPVANARITATRGRVAVSDAAGDFSLAGVRAGSSVRIASSAFAPIAKPLFGRTAVLMRVQPYEGTASIGASGGELRSTLGSRASARFRPGSLAATSELVLAAPDPRRSGGLRAMSGDFSAQKGGVAGRLSITSPLYLGARDQPAPKLASDAPVELDFPAWRDVDPATLSLFVYDEAAATWTSTPSTITAVTNPDATKVLRTQSSSLGWLALGELDTELSCVHGCVVDGAGAPLTHTEVAATGTDHFSQQLGETDSQGCFQLEVRANAAIVLEARTPQGELLSITARSGPVGGACVDVGTLGRSDGGGMDAGSDDAGSLQDGGNRDTGAIGDTGALGTNDARASDARTSDADASDGAGNGCTAQCPLGQLCVNGTCQACGNETQACCGGTTCAANLTCSSAGICACGAPGEPCCGGQTCDGPFQCNSAKLCSCGGQGEACCPATPTNSCNPGMSCTSGNRCGCIRAIATDVVQRLDGTLWSYLASLGPTGSTAPFRIDDQSGTSPFLPTALSEINGALCAIDASKSAWCFGANNKMLGDGSNPDGTGHKPRPTRVITELANATPLADVETIALGPWHACAATAGGKVWCWGSGSFGELGTGYTGWSGVAVPTVTVLGGPQFDGVDALAIGQSWRTCAHKTDNTVWCWGDNVSRLIDPASTENQVRTPLQLTGLQNRALSVHLSGDSICARMVDRTVSCWGAAGLTGRAAMAQDRALGNVLTLSGAPLDNVDQVVVTAYGYCALRDAAAARSLWCWGTSYGSGGLAAPYLLNGLPATGIALVADASGSAHPTLVDSAGAFWTNGQKPAMQVSCSN
jgi:hypothetical protein